MYLENISFKNMSLKGHNGDIHRIMLSLISFVILQTNFLSNLQ